MDLLGLIKIESSLDAHFKILPYMSEKYLNESVWMA